jgi:MraZ protein
VVVRVSDGGEHMFRGEFQHSLDAKGRVIIPSRLRESLGDRFVVTRGMDKCLFVYPAARWTRLEQQLSKQPFTRKDYRDFNRLFFSGAMEIEPDKQGRVLIPQYLREYAEIDKDVMIVGVADRVEIWDVAGWKKFFDETDKNYAALAEKLVDFDL